MSVIKLALHFYIRAQGAEAGPPLGTVLGNLGINATKFAKEFNDLTKDLPNYLLLKTHVFILEDRSTTFSIDLPSTGFILMLMKIQITNKLTKELINYITLKNVIQTSLLKFPALELEQSLPMVLGTVQSCGLFVITYEKA